MSFFNILQSGQFQPQTNASFHDWDRAGPQVDSLILVTGRGSVTVSASGAPSTYSPTPHAFESSSVLALRIEIYSQFYSQVSSTIPLAIKFSLTFGEIGYF